MIYDGMGVRVRAGGPAGGGHSGGRGQLQGARWAEQWGPDSRGGRG